MPLFVPKCLSTGTVKCLVANGVTAAEVYREHFRVKTLGLHQLHHRLDIAQQRLVHLETLNPELFPDLIATGKQAVADVEAQINALLGDDNQSFEQAPGAETGLVGKLNTLLSRHQKISAKEEADFSRLLQISTRRLSR